MTFSSIPSQARASQINFLQTVLNEEVEQPSKSKVVAIRIFKTISITASYIAVYPFLKPAQEVSSNHLLKVLFPAGEVLTWGTLFGWAASNIIDDVLFDGETERIWAAQANSTFSKCYWIIVFILGIATQTPTAYIAYHYNDKNLFWTFFTPSVYSLFTVYSLHSFTKKILYTDNYISRWLNNNTNRISIFKVKENFNSLCSHVISKLFEKDSSVVSNLLSLASAVPQPAEEFQRKFLYTLKYGIEAKMKVLDTTPIYIKNGEKLIATSNIISAIGKSYFEGFLVYKGSILLLKTSVVSVIIGAIVACPNLYLSIESSQSVSLRIFQSLTSLYTGNRLPNPFFDRCLVKIPSKLIYPIAALISSFGMGAFTKIVDDAIGFDSFEASLLSIIIISGVALVLLNAMSFLLETGTQQLQEFISSPEEKEIFLLAHKLKLLSKHIEKMPDEMLMELFRELNALLNSSDENSFFDCLANDNNLRAALGILNESLATESSQEDE